MAYMVEITQVKCQTDLVCTKKAVVEVRDRWNGSRGKYCRRHGNQLAAKLTQAGA